MLGAKLYTEKIEADKYIKKKKRKKIIISSIVFCLLFVAISRINLKTRKYVKENSEKEQKEVIDQPSKDEKSTESYLDKIINNIQDSEGYNGVRYFNHENIEIVTWLFSDYEQLWRKKNQYIDKVNVNVKLEDELGNKVKDYKGISIELFRNKNDLTARIKYLEAQNEYLDNIYGDEYGGFLPTLAGLPVQQDIYSKGNAIIHMNKAIDSKKKIEIVKWFNKAIAKVKYFDNSKVNDKIVDEIEKTNEEYLNQWKNKYSQDIIVSKIAELKNNMQKQVNCAYASGKQCLIDKASQDMLIYNVKKYQEDYHKWETMLKEAKENSEKETLSSGMLAMQKQMKQIVYPEGTYQVGIDIIPGEYVIIANEKSNYKTNCYAYYGLEKYSVFGNTIIEIKDISVYEFEEIRLSNATMYHIDNAPKLELKSPGIFKVGKHIAAGDYIISADFQVRYRIVDEPRVLSDKFLFQLDFGWKATPEGTIVTLKDGEYLCITNENIKIRKK